MHVVCSATAGIVIAQSHHQLAQLCMDSAYCLRLICALSLHCGMLRVCFVIDSTKAQSSTGAYKQARALYMFMQEQPCCM